MVTILIPDNRAVRVSQYFSKTQMVLFNFYMNSGVMSLTFMKRPSIFEFTFQKRIKIL